jgi:hypothetical protein
MTCLCQVKNGIDNILYHRLFHNRLQRRVVVLTRSRGGRRIGVLRDRSIGAGARLASATHALTFEVAQMRDGRSAIRLASGSPAES